ncbi:unnamed protein product [Cylindrotheca closterium]|uniref:Kinetochore protein Nuf2 n=1 Tax=Cylindrotheca closterium TaxID=2856 RepID=A0AAD2CK33_9STRA|nr:unnamed protein product [Cylindrotheca closterium]
MAGFMHADYGGMPPKQDLSKFVFPVLKSANILQCMTELGIELTKEELTEPTRHKDKIRKVFWQLLDICCGTTEEDLEKQAPPTDGLLYPEVHDSFIDMMFFRDLRQCMTICGVFDFSLKDLYVPRKDRLRTQLSALINMAKFREEQLKMYAELNEPRAQYLSELALRHEENKELEAHREEAMAKNYEVMEEMDKIVSECDELEAEISRRNKGQREARLLVENLKKEGVVLNDKFQSAKWTLEEARNEAEQLMAQVVSSPDRRKEELLRKRERLEKAKAEVRNLQELIQTNKANTIIVQQSVKEIEEAMELQKQVIEEAERYEESMGEVQKTMKEVEENNEKIQELTEKADESERALLRVEEKLAHMRKQSKMKMEAAQDRLEIAKEQLVQVEKERREGMARVNAGEAEVQALKAKMEEEQIKTNKEIDAMIEEYKKAESVFMARNERRMQVIEAAF